MAELQPEDMPDGLKMSKEEKEEWNQLVVDDAIKHSDEYQFQGQFNPRQQVITRTQLNMKTDDVVRRKNDGKPIIPIMFFDNPQSGQVDWLLTDADAMAVTQGYVCENCLCWQRIPNSPKCQWENGGTCGYVNYQP